MKTIEDFTLNYRNDGYYDVKKHVNEWWVRAKEYKRLDIVEYFCEDTTEVHFASCLEVSRIGTFSQVDILDLVSCILSGIAVHIVDLIF